MGVEPAGLRTFRNPRGLTLTVIITGGGRGIGAVCAWDLAHAKYDVVVADIKPDPALAAIARNVELDVRHHQDFEDLVAQVRHPAALVACAALPPYHPNPIEIVDVNLIAVLDNAMTFVKKANHGARIILFSSI